MNQESLVNACQQRALNTSLPFVHTARRSYRLNDSVKSLDHFLNEKVIKSRYLEEGEVVTVKISQASRGEERKIALGRRRYDRKQEGFVGRVKPFLRRSKKTSKKISLRFTCQTCKKSSMYCLGRLRKFEWMTDKKKKHAEPTW